MGRIKYLSATEWLKYLGQLELAATFLFVVSSSWYLPGLHLRLRSSVPLTLLFPVKRKIMSEAALGAVGRSPDCQMLSLSYPSIRSLLE